MKMTQSPLAKGIALSLGLAAGNSLAADFAIEEIVVTATKRAESIQDVPISVSAFSGDFLEKSGLKDLQDLGNIAPNLTISKSSQSVNQRIAVRGVGSVGNNAIDPSVAVYIDGVYMPRPGAVLGSLKDIEVAEVLRGPQGTLFGRNASMGALNIRTYKPSLDETSLKVDAGIGDYGAHDTTLIANAPLTDTIASRVVASYSSLDGYGENSYDGNNNVGGNRNNSLKTSFLYEPSENLSALLRLDYQEIDGDGGIIEVHPDSITAARSAQITARTGGNAPDLSGGLDHEINQKHNDQLSDRQWGANLDITWDDAFAGHTLRSITSHRDWNNDTSEYSVLRLPLEDAERATTYGSQSFSQELQLISPEGETFDYVAGLYYFQEDYDIDQDIHLGSDFCPVIAGIVGQTAACHMFTQYNAIDTAFSQEASSWAAFFQGTVHLNEKADLTLGIRYSADEKEAEFNAVGNNPVAGSLFAATENHDLKFDDEQVTWFANGKYFINGDTMLFATVSTGYKSGGFNSQMSRDALSGDERIFDSEEVTNYELGIKSTLLDGRLIANATLYRTDIENFQDRSFQGLNFVVANAGELRQQGLEMDLKYQPMEELFVNLGYSYLDSAFLSFDQASPLPGAGGTQDLKGKPNHYSAEHQVNLSAQWEASLGDTGMSWFVRGEAAWTDDMNIGATTNNNPQTVQDAYTLTNLRMGLNAEDERWNVSAFVENLTDEEYCTSMFDQPAGSLLGTQSDNGTLVRCVMGAPRTIGVRGSYYFD
ncbi:TonB-dependent receptor [Maricurvus nonylphenolicus]|uniref:TonB-dependent receptor n=1 Tax=Maricurvus nonylphenolicus TaxID=1008307 RepID=UPI0036F3F9EE